MCGVLYMKRTQLIVVDVTASGDSWSGEEGGFDAHAVYAGDNAMSASSRSSLATEGVRTTLAALLNRYNYPAAAQSLHTGIIK